MERPILRANVPGNLSAEEFAEWIQVCVEAMTPEARKNFQSLSCKTSEPSPEGVYAVNNFDCRGETLVYYHISRLNHSCNPNCAHSFDIDSGIGQIRALRDIKE